MRRHGFSLSLLALVAGVFSGFAGGLELSFKAISSLIELQRWSDVRYVSMSDPNTLLFRRITLPDMKVNTASLSFSWLTLFNPGNDKIEEPVRISLQKMKSTLIYVKVMPRNFDPYLISDCAEPEKPIVPDRYNGTLQRDFCIEIDPLGKNKVLDLVWFFDETQKFDELEDSFRVYGSESANDFMNLNMPELLSISRSHYIAIVLLTASSSLLLSFGVILMISRRKEATR